MNTTNTTGTKAKRLTKKDVEAAERAEAVETLRRFGVVEGAQVTATVMHVSGSGMTRSVMLQIATVRTEHGETFASIEDITLLAAKAVGDKCNKHGHLIVGGCGTDVRFLAVYNLSQVMFPNTPGVVYKDRNGKPISGGYVLRCNKG